MGDANGAADGLREIDLRSDTVTRPTPEMLAAAADADVDDDVQGFDPTTKKLEEHAAKLFGKEAALFMSTGTQANLCALMSHCPERGSEFIVGDQAHIYIYEQGGSATVAGIHPRVVRNQPDGSLAISDVIEAVREENPHFPVTRLVCIENTHNKCGGIVLSKEYIDELADAVHARGLKLHMDGARVMNACAALGISPKDLCAGCDSISLCLSKGLGAPLGSLLMGSKDFIARASRNRKVLGGAMRQNGVIAAMGLLCIEKYSGESMVQDHANLKRLATALAKLPGVEKLDLGACQSNMVYFDVAAPHDGASVKKALRDKGIIISGSAGSPIIRIVTHHQVRATDIDTVIDAMTEILS